MLVTALAVVHTWRARWHRRPFVPASLVCWRTTAPSCPRYGGRLGTLSFTRATTHTQEQEISAVGHNRFGFDSRVETETLRSLYLVSPACRSGEGSETSCGRGHRDTLYKGKGVCMLCSCRTVPHIHLLILVLSLPIGDPSPLWADPPPVAQISLFPGPDTTR